MATTREIKRRITSVKNINQVTRALEAVSASYVRRAQSAALASRPYAQYAYEVLVNVAAQSKGDPPHPPLYVHEPPRIASADYRRSRLAGAYNQNIIRRRCAVEYYQRPVH